MIIAITGTPGAGKSTLSKKLSVRLKYPILDVNKYLEINKEFVTGFDKKRDSKIIDVKKLGSDLAKHIKKNKITDVIIDSHLSHHFPKSMIDLVIVATCDIKKLKKRLEERKYSDGKVRENLDCEIFEVCRTEALEAGHNVVGFDCSGRCSLDNLVKKMKKLKNDLVLK